MKHEPTMEATALLERIGAEVDNLGFEFVHSVFKQPGGDGDGGR